MAILANDGNKQGYGELIGSSSAMTNLYHNIEQAASVDLSVLITGETGTGKDLIANEIHHRSHRASGPFVALNLGTLSKELMVSELFGHMKGAFTGAGETKQGRFAEAHNGTLFLDEISTADESVQIALLRVLDNATFRPIGAKRDKRVDVRIIAASNEDLNKAVRMGVFRKDLLHRFEVLHIQVPPLRSRKRDIPELADYFLGQIRREFNLELQDLASETIDLLVQYPWPGNVRELKNVIAHAAVVAQEGTILPEHLPQRVVRLPKRRTEGELLRGLTNVSMPEQDAWSPMMVSAQDCLQDPTSITIPLGLTIDQIQKIYLVKTLSACGYNKTQAAKQLGISRKTLYDRLTRWGYDQLAV